MFTKGIRVSTPLGDGIVAYVRMAPPTYTTPEVVSVVLDHRKGQPAYAGTVFPARDITVLPEKK